MFKVGKKVEKRINFGNLRERGGTIGIYSSLHSTSFFAVLRRYGARPVNMQYMIIITIM